MAGPVTNTRRRGRKREVPWRVPRKKLGGVLDIGVDARAGLGRYAGRALASGVVEASFDEPQGVLELKTKDGSLVTFHVRQMIAASVPDELSYIKGSTRGRKAR